MNKGKSVFLLLLMCALPAAVPGAISAGCSPVEDVNNIVQEEPAPAATAGEAIAEALKEMSKEDLIAEMKRLESMVQVLKNDFGQVLPDLEGVVADHVYQSISSEHDRYLSELSTIWQKWSDQVDKEEEEHLAGFVLAYRNLVEEHTQILLPKPGP